MTRFLPKAFATASLIKTVFASVKKHNHVTFTEIEIKITKGPSRHTKYVIYISNGGLGSSVKLFYINESCANKHSPKEL